MVEWLLYTQNLDLHLSLDCDHRVVTLVCSNLTMYLGRVLLSGILYRSTAYAATSHCYTLCLDDNAFPRLPLENNPPRIAIATPLRGVL